VWCRRDAARTRLKFCELDDLAAILHYQLTGHHPATTSPPGAGGDAPSPSPGGDELLDLNRWLADWDDAYREWHNREHPEARWDFRVRRGHLATVRLTTISWLNERFDGILASPMAADFGLEAAQWHRELMAKTRTGTGRRRGAIQCPWCDYMTLVCEDGADYWACGNPGCRCRLSMAEYHDLAGRELERAG
jgi:hypothetical protein